MAIWDAVNKGKTLQFFFQKKENLKGDWTFVLFCHIDYRLAETVNNRVFQVLLEVCHYLFVQYLNKFLPKPVRDAQPTSCRCLANTLQGCKLICSTQTEGKENLCNQGK